jgi:hypothetical protein
MSKFKIFCILTTALIFSGCATEKAAQVTKQDAAPNMYVEVPKAILVLPAVNKSTAADAADYYATTIAEPLTLKGYYVLPMSITNNMLKQEGIVDGAQLRNTDFSLYKNHFGADAVLFVTINEWKTSYVVISGSVTVGIGFELISTKTGETLWRYENTIVVNTSGDNNNGGGLLAALIATAINTAMQDYLPIARNVNQTATFMLPAGPYHNQHNHDQLTLGYMPSK